MSFAGHTVSAPEIIFAEGRDVRLLGHGLFGRFAVTCDQRNKLVAFELPEAAPAK